MAGQSVVISVLADSNPFKKGMDNIGKQTGGLKAGLAGVGKALAVGLAVGTVALAGFLGASFKAVAEVERLDAQTVAALKSTGEAAGRSLAQIKHQADALEKLTGIEAEAITVGQNLLLTFTQIRGPNFDAATKSALDLSVAMGIDMKSASTLVGKALNDPIKGISALSRVGVQLTDDQKKLIKSLVETGDVAGAQAVILKELNVQFGGSAEAFGNTFLGSVEKVKNSFGQLGESIVTAFLPPATTALNKVNDLFLGLAESPGFQSFMDNLADLADRLLSGDIGSGWLGTLADLVLGFSPLNLLLQAIQPLLPDFIQSFRDLGDALNKSGILEALQDLAANLGGELADAAVEIGPLLLLIAQGLVETLIAVLPLVPQLIGLLGPIVDLIGPLTEFLAVLFTPTGEESKLPEIVGFISGALTILGGILEYVSGLWAGQLNLLTGFIKWVSGEFTLQQLIDSIMETGGPIAEMFRWIIDLSNGIKRFVADSVSNISRFGSNVKTKLNEVGTFFGSLPGKILKAVAGFGSLLFNSGKNIVQGLINGVGSLAQRAVSSVLNIGKSMVDGVKSFLGIKSPSRVFQQLGQYTIQGLVLGLEKTDGIKRAMGNLSAQVTGGFAPSLTVPLAPGGPSRFATGSGAQNVYQITLQTLLADATAGRAIVEAIEEYERLNGKRP